MKHVRLIAATIAILAVLMLGAYVLICDNIDRLNELQKMAPW